MKLLLAAALLFSGADDGWVTWRVETNQEVGYWCCVTWSAGQAVSKSCQLDGGGLNINNNKPTIRSTGEMQIYVKLQGGRATHIRTLSPQCPVETEAGIRDLGLIATDESLDWLSNQVSGNRRVSSDALLAISAHESPRAVEMLVSAIENRDLQKKVREEALFWLVTSGSDEAYAYLDRLLSSR